MRVRRLGVSLVLPVLLMAARPFSGGAADPRPHVVDKNHSQINFIADSRLISARGFFGAWDATISLDPANVATSSVSITIDAASIDTRVERRDTHLKSADFFDVEKYPKITFVSTAVRPKAGDQMDIEGDLTIRGTTKRITVPASMVFYEEGAGRFRGEFVLKRSEYGVSYDSKVNPIKDDVTVQWDIAIQDPAARK
jgi:polyisoprenoid-binding protein YceI